MGEKLEDDEVFVVAVRPTFLSEQKAGAGKRKHLAVFVMKKSQNLIEAVDSTLNYLQQGEGLQTLPVPLQIVQAGRDFHFSDELGWARKHNSPVSDSKHRQPITDEDNEPPSLAVCLQRATHLRHVEVEKKNKIKI